MTLSLAYPCYLLYVPTTVLPDLTAAREVPPGRPADQPDSACCVLEERGDWHGE